MSSTGTAPTQERRARVLTEQQALTPNQPVDYGGQGLSYTRGRAQRHTNQQPIIPDIADDKVLQPDVVQAPPSSNGPRGDASNTASPASSPANPISHMGGAKPQTSQAGLQGKAVTTGPTDRGLMGKVRVKATPVTNTGLTGAELGAKGRNAAPGQATTTGPAKRGFMGRNPREERNALSDTGTGADKGARGRDASPGQATTTGPTDRGKMGKKGKDGKDGNGSGSTGTGGNGNPHR